MVQVHGESSATCGWKIALKIASRFLWRRPDHMGAGFNRFLDTIKKQPNKALSYRFATPVDLTVGYNPNQSSAGMQVFSYSQVKPVREELSLRCTVKKT